MRLHCRDANTVEAILCAKLQAMKIPRLWLFLICNGVMAHSCVNMLSMYIVARDVAIFVEKRPSTATTVQLVPMLEIVLS